MGVTQGSHGGGGGGSGGRGGGAYFTCQPARSDALDTWANYRGLRETSEMLIHVHVY